MIIILDNINWNNSMQPIPTNISQWHNIKEEAHLLEGTISKQIIEEYISKYFDT